MAAEVFRRTEQKYIVCAQQVHSLLQRLGPMLVPDCPHGREYYTICNLYFDTEDSYYIRTSLEKPSYKEKLRLRSYGVPQRDDHVYFEIKKKVNGVVSKRRTPLALWQANRFLQYGSAPDSGNLQVWREIEVILKTRRLAPVLYLAYDRCAFSCPEIPGLRITFDRNIRTRRFDLWLNSGDFGAPLLQDGNCIMEIKMLGGMPLWLSEALCELGLYPSGFSKYGAEYLRGLMHQLNEEGMQRCLNPSLSKLLAPLSPPARQSLVS